MDRLDRIRLFGLVTMPAERELDRVERVLKIDLQRAGREEAEGDYYPQFDQAHRVEAAEMSRHYELFYCLEKSIRQLIAETLRSQHGENWWINQVPQGIRDNAAGNLQKEIDSGVTQRSEDDIDYTNFGELGEIVRNNWDCFDAIFSSQKAFSKIMTSLNTLRGPIAHCCPLAEDEVVRLQLTLRDWYRLME